MDKSQSVRSLHSQMQSENVDDSKKSKVEVSHVANRPRKSPYPLISVAQAVQIVLSESEVQRKIDVNIESKNHRNLIN